ncbi:MAG: hypothetical protein JRG93_12975, partial [Deltaproteobacteria bacterium]|nr:hypothetical protein [Deltaproteobacteria bacterium]
MRIKIAWDMKKFATLLGFVLAVSGCGEGDPVDLCMDVDCSDGNECVQDGTCDPADGQCIPGANETDGTVCDASGNPGTCQTGVCVGLCDGVDCSDGNDCTEDVCAPADGSCSNPNEPDDTVCEFSSGVGGICDGAGTCEDAKLCEGVDCSDGNDCTQDVCDPADGSCSNPNEPHPTECDFRRDVAGICVEGTCEDAML